MHYVELDDAGCLVGLFPLDGEQAGTEFYDGIVLPVLSGIEHNVACPFEIPWASSGQSPISIDLLSDALANVELPDWTEIGMPTDLLLLSVPLAATKLGANNGCRNGHIKRL